MADLVISTPSVIINNEVIKIKPNSLKINDGLGEFKTRVESAGGGQVSTIMARDVSSAIGKVAFAIEPTADNADLVRGWKSNLNNNAIQIIDNASGFTRTFVSACLKNDPDIMLSSDGEIALEWESASAS